MNSVKGYPPTPPGGLHGKYFPKNFLTEKWKYQSKVETLACTHMLVNLTNLQNRTSRLRDMSRDMFRTKTMVTRHVSLTNHHSFF